MRPDIVGAAEIAERLNVQVKTVGMWATRRNTTHFPEPDWKLAGMNVWKWTTIERWAITHKGY